MGEVKVSYGDSAQDTAILLLAAADETETPRHVVRHLDGAFYVPEELAKKAGVDYESDEDGDPEPVRSEHHPDDIGQSVAQDAAEEPEPEKPAAKKAVAKKAAAKKSDK